MIVRGSRRLFRSFITPAIGCVLLALLMTALNLIGVLVVVFGTVVPLWQVAAVLLLAGLAWAVTTAASGRSEAARSKAPRWLTAALVAATCIGTGLSAIGDLAMGATYTVLDPPTGVGCRVVVRETSFLMSGSGEVYKVGGLGLGRRVGSWQVDDGYRPIAAGSYKLNWTQHDGVLQLYGGPFSPVVGTGRHELHC